MLLWHMYICDCSFIVNVCNSSVIILAFVKSEGKQKQKQVRSKKNAESEHSGSGEESSESLVSTSPAGGQYKCVPSLAFYVAIFFDMA